MACRAIRTMQHPMSRKPGPRRALSCVRRSTRAAARTLPLERPSNSVTGRRSRVRPVETEVRDGLYLVVTGVVLHRFLHRDADYGTDVHVRFPVRAVGANAKTRASCVVGRVLTHKDWCADTARLLFDNERYAASQQFQKESGPGRALFLTRSNTFSTTTPVQRQHRMDRIARPGRDCLPGACGTDVPKDWR
jgi:hypothetical protein